MVVKFWFRLRYLLAQWWPNVGAKFVQSQHLHGGFSTQMICHFMTVRSVTKCTMLLTKDTGQAKPMLGPSVIVICIKGTTNKQDKDKPRLILGRSDLSLQIHITSVDCQPWSKAQWFHFTRLAILPWASSAQVVYMKTMHVTTLIFMWMLLLGHHWC